MTNLDEIKKEALEWLLSSWGESPDIEPREGFTGFLAGYLQAISDLELFISINEHDLTRHPLNTIDNYIEHIQKELKKV